MDTMDSTPWVLGALGVALGLTAVAALRCALVRTPQNCETLSWAATSPRGFTG